MQQKRKYLRFEVCELETPTVELEHLLWLGRLRLLI
jgi:hypothetical protein